jgi:hypothetical protein
MLAVYTNTGRIRPDTAPSRRVRAAGAHPPRPGHRPVAVPPVMTPRLVGRVRRNAGTVAPPDPDDTATPRPPGRRQRRSRPPALSGGPGSTTYPDRVPWAEQFLVCGCVPARSSAGIGLRSDSP